MIDAREPFRGRSLRPPQSLRDPSGFMPASAELAWRSGECLTAAVQSPQQVEGAVANSDGPGQDLRVADPQPDEW